MVLLGNSFPEFLKKNRFKVGAVIYTHCPFTDPPKNKYHLVCCVNPLLVLLINSNIPLFILEREPLKRCQVELSKADHPFLYWNSFLNCIDAHNAYDISFFKNEFEYNFDSFYKGDLSIECIRDVIRAVNESPVMIPKYKKLITRELNLLLENI